MDKYIGIKFYSRPHLEIEVTNKYGEKYYQVKEVDIITGREETTTLLTADQIQKDLNNQEAIIESINKAIEWHKEQEIKEEIERKKELAKQQEYENTFGYTDNMTPMQKGKILKTLNKKFNYYSNGKYIGSLTRKNFIKLKLEEGYKVEHKTDVKYYAKGMELKTKANEYRLIDKDGTYYEITKTEYDYIMYLIKNNIIAA